MSDETPNRWADFTDDEIKSLIAALALYADLMPVDGEDPLLAEAREALAQRSAASPAGTACRSRSARTPNAR